MRNTLLPLLAILAATASTGCSSDEPVSHPDASLADASLADARTDAGTTDAATPDSGGDPVPCNMDLPCPAPASDRFMICGRLIDLENSEPIVGPTASLVKVSFYDALQFASNPQAVPEFSVSPDSCGRFVSSIPGHVGVLVPDTMYIGVAVDDVGTPAPGGDFVATLVAGLGVGGGQRTGFHAYAMHETTAASWSGAADPSLVEQGVFAGIFIDTSKPHVGIYSGTPAPGVTLTVDDQPPMAPAHAFYFDDPAPLLRTHLGSLGVTGQNGTALLVQSGGLNTFNGSGGTSAGCTWNGALATTIPGAVFVSERESTCP